MHERLEELLHRYVDAGAVPGAVALRGEMDAEVVAVGVSAVGGALMRDDEIFRIQSMTKAVAAVAALQLVEIGYLSLDGDLEWWLPEIANRPVLSSPTAELDDTVVPVRPVTLRHLLTNTSGYGMALTESPLQEAMARNGTEAGPNPVGLGADEWLGRLASLPLAFQPGEGWRYHHCFGILGILLSRVAGLPLGKFLTEDDLLGPLGMHDTAFWVGDENLHRLPATYRHDPHGLVETEPAGGGFYADPPPFDVSHGELVSSVHDYRLLLQMLVTGGVANGRRIISEEHLRMMTTDQVSEKCKTPESFFPGFWDGMGWGFGVAVNTAGPRRGRYGWSGGLGTDFFVDPDGSTGILMTQVEMGEQITGLLQKFGELD